MPSVEWNRKHWQEKYEELGEGDLYFGSHWGDPDPLKAFPHWMRAGLPESLAARLLRIKRLNGWLQRRRRDNAQYHAELYTVLQNYLRPYVTSQTHVLEIGFGGGRWTEHMLHAKALTLVDINETFFEIVAKRFAHAADKMRFYQTDGFELNGIESNSIDFVFSFGAFVHIEPEGIEQYLDEIARVLKPNALAIIQYADKEKPRAQKIAIFSDMTPAKMEAFVQARPTFTIVHHDTTLLWHSSVIILRKQ